MEIVIENPERIDVQVSSSRYSLDLVKFFKPQHSKSALLILNQKITIPDIFQNLWKNYNVHVCADGGANRLYEYFETDAERCEFLPDYIVGDLDSIKKEIFDFYTAKKVIIIKQSSQYATDFMKSKDLISLHFHSSVFREKIKTLTGDNHGIEQEEGILQLYKSERPSWETDDIYLLALNAIDGRFDQTVHSITQLYTTARTDSYFRLCYVTPTDLIFLVPNGGTTITYSAAFRDDCIGNCGLLPLGGPTVIKRTEGLKWDVENWPTSVVDGKVSSSNRFVGRTCCYIDVPDPIVVNVELLFEHLRDYL